MSVTLEREMIQLRKPAKVPFERVIYVHTWHKGEDGSNVETLKPLNNAWSMAISMSRAIAHSRIDMNEDTSITDIHIVALMSDSEASEYRLTWEKGSIAETVFEYEQS